MWLPKYTLPGVAFFILNTLTLTCIGSSLTFTLVGEFPTTFSKEGAMRLRSLMFLAAAILLMLAMTSSVSSGLEPTVKVGSFTAEVGDQGTVDLELLNVAFPGVGDWVLDIQRDNSVVSIVSCEPTPGSFCNDTFSEVSVRSIGVAVLGLEGDNLLAELTLKCESGGTSALNIVVEQLNDSTKGGPQPVNASLENGSVVCLGDSAPTTTNTEVPTATNTPAATNTPVLEPSATDLPVEPTETGEMIETPLPTATITPTVLPTKTPTPLPLLGDTDCDGGISSLDSLLILQFAAALISSLPCLENGDISGDGQIDPLDSALILQIAAGLI